MIRENLQNIYKELPPDVKLVAVSKFHPVEAMLEAVDAGQLRFGENRPQEFQKKVLNFREQHPEIAGRLEWHFIGHLQTNKLKMVLPYADLVQSIDSQHLLQAVDAWGKTAQKTVNVLLELHIGAEQTKQGFVEEEALEILFNASKYRNIRFRGLMGMASHTPDGHGLAHRQRGRHPRRLRPHLRLLRLLPRPLPRAGQLQRTLHRHVRRLEAGARLWSHHGPHRHRNLRPEGILISKGCYLAPPARSSLIIAAATLREAPLPPRDSRIAA